MIKFYVLTFMLTAFIMLVCTVYISTKHAIRQNKLNISIIQLLSVGIITCLAYSHAISVPNELAAEWGYALYFAGIDWILITFLFYARQYTRVWLENYAAPLITTSIAVLDNISLFFNYKWHHAYYLEKRYLGDEWFYDFKIHDYYVVHLVFCYILVILILLILTKKTVATSGFHRNRYLSILIMFTGIILLNILYVFFDYPVDVSICLYAIASIFVGYYTLLYNPKTFVEYMLSTITERMECALISFDENDFCIYSNQLANRMFCPSGDKKLLEQRFKMWRAGKETNSISNTSWNDVYNLNGDEYRFDVHFNKIYDKKGYYCGCYLSFYDVTGDFIAYEEEKYRSSHDSLTGALNRESFYEEVQRLLEENSEIEYVMVCSNIKGFKLINDMFGVEEADRLLIRAADLIREKLTPSAAFARLEADRFAVLMPKNHYSEELFMTGMNQVSNFLNNAQYRMVILLGVYDIYDRHAPVVSMCDGAFLAIDSIKDSFKNTIAYYGDMLRHEYMSEQKIIGEFEDALQMGQFAMFLQPVVTTDGRMTICEALVRWIHPERGIIAPASFIPLLERTGYIYKLDLYMWEQAAKRLAYWSSLGHDELSISVNISVKDFYYMDIYETLVSLVEKYNIEPDRLKLEITETVFMTEKERQIDIISSLKEYGFLVEIDDFGSGYSSLNMLKEVPADILKMDMAFLTMDKNAPRGRKIVNTIITLAKALGMMVIIEGVETEDQLNYLKGTGADYLQGYYFNKPLPVRKFEEIYL
ncbi:diguanylate cyclase (GGDEF) domain-containing protein [Pseudobutyrivibrio sp. YE44]|uniref:GGDEF domain-containing protein n=1 Tax=Pseudobutyrivibrio sp. YE44 TaxID=1520802 RepID=UPI0008833A33|nr:GGDEF domain-containing protein [Pseudobutyrivibrio sp. YE44]SDB29703.1 diguanylate cyclase (GGDEF) domain-containing protein [Pseudobutyrivibrio sp. YE44]